jgi:hypothetical protein
MIVQLFMLISVIMQIMPIPMPIPIPVDSGGQRYYYGTLTEVQVINGTTYLCLDQSRWFAVITYRINPNNFLNKDVEIIIQGSSLNSIKEDKEGVQSMKDMQRNSTILLIVGCVAFIIAVIGFILGMYRPGGI